MSDDLTAWLRAVVGKRLALARHVISVQAEVESGVVVVPAEPPPASPRWREQSSGILWTGEGSEGDAWHGTWAMGDSRLTRFIADNDPETVIGQCEAELAVLDFHDLAETWERAEGKPLRQAEVLRIVVRQVGYAYRRRPGYQEVAWKP